MKKIAGVILAVSASLFACGGCVDAPAAQAGANSINGTFDSGDSALSQAFQAQINLMNETLASEIKNQREYNSVVNLEIDSVVNLKQLGFSKEIKAAIRSKK
ncbi:MAG: hypothetical protein PHO62_07945 [Sulfurimonas sp.]|uniref:hypothetical protein n=1 Tax=Sulfurimonas sp. TaxID=2022749 RepID=UPI00261104E8|nr:hypothetical protein [Sulfurimonas sp.]MDD5373339.1 hypothetical protein [Sulfurimonas sp.]